MTDSLFPLYILLGVKVVGLLCLAFYFQNIIAKKVITRMWANIIMMLLLIRTVFGFLLIYHNLGGSYNFLILMDHMFAMIDAMVLCFIGIFLRK